MRASVAEVSDVVGLVVSDEPTYGRPAVPVRHDPSHDTGNFLKCPIGPKPTSAGPMTTSTPIAPFWCGTCCRRDSDYESTFHPIGSGAAWNLKMSPIWAARRPIASIRVEAIEGDLVLMRIVGDRRTLGSHIGVLIMVNGQEWVLHAIERMGSLLTPVRKLTVFQLELMGYYRAKRQSSTLNGHV